MNPKQIANHIIPTFIIFRIIPKFDYLVNDCASPKQDPT